nr:hypothetical protein Iba_chr14dCG2390 [Ipomoea batatas]
MEPRGLFYGICPCPSGVVKEGTVAQVWIWKERDGYGGYGRRKDGYGRRENRYGRMGDGYGGYGRRGMDMEGRGMDIAAKERGMNIEGRGMDIVAKEGGMDMAAKERGDGMEGGGRILKEEWRLRKEGDGYRKRLMEPIDFGKEMENNDAIEEGGYTATFFDIQYQKLDLGIE